MPTRLAGRDGGVAAGYTAKRHGRMPQIQNQYSIHLYSRASARVLVLGAARMRHFLDKERKGNEARVRASLTHLTKKY
jgi:hypothetical protein